MSTTMTITAVVPTCNRRDLAALTTRTILEQSGVDVRLVVVDDGSSDGTARHLRERFDDRLCVVRLEGPPSGAAAARNRGLAEVDTEFVAFCDDDDLWAPDKLVAQVEALAADPRARWCTTGAICIDGAWRVIEAQRLTAGGDVLPQILRRNVVPGGGSAVLASTDLVRDVGGFRTDQPSSEDWDLWIRLAERSPLAVVDRPLVAYRIWSGGKSRKVGRMDAAFDTITQRYAHLSGANEVGEDKDGHRRFLAKLQLRNGERVGPARTFASLGRWERAALALLAPRLMDWAGTRRALRAVDPDWIAEGRAWLARLRADDGTVFEHA